ncbi:MAG: outer membrane protein assembly factor BamA [Acidobacteriota bacterium]|nr:outer membrane protein assembly factor BamA [Blastocatellia bacterium]MDW8412391.1 outer membrane protein assembly factor BamA [Acidobacteriota bacterium]
MKLLARLFLVLFLLVPLEISAQDVRIVENVDIRGNRSVPTDTIKLYIQTKKDDIYSEQQVQRDYQAILAQGYFDEFESRVYIEEGPRGGVIVIFYVKERPIIRDITYEGLKSIQESDIIQRFRERRVQVTKESRYDPVAVEQARRILAEMLAERGKPHAQIDPQVEDISATTVAINFVVNEGRRVRVSKIEFEGNEVFSDRQLRRAMKLVKQSSFLTIFTSKDIYDKRKLDEDLQRVRIYMGEKGYIRPQIGEPQVEEIGEVGLPIPIFGRRGEGIKIKIPIKEGKQYRFGKITTEGNTLFTEEQILAVTGMRTGDIASSKVIREGVFERLRKLYGRSGYIQATTDLSQSFNEADNTVDFTIIIEEGKPFTVRRIEFKGNSITRDHVLRREILVNEGEIYNQELFDLSRLRLNQLGYFEEIKEEDVQFRTDERNGYVDIDINVKEKGRQQISFTGGVSGIGGSFIGISYSTNNLFGYGESVGVDIAAGNRQRNISLSFTEPYLKGRPISLGVSFFSSKFLFFGGGLNALGFVPGGGFGTGFFGGAFDSDSLFTRDSTGFSISAAAPLTLFTKKYLKYTRFTRVSLGYSFSSSSVTDPPVNRDSNPDNDIPVTFNQPDITTSTIIGSIVYNTINSPLDPTNGTSLAFSMNFSGLGGDVKLIYPSFEFKHFRPVFSREREKPHVLGMRLLFEYLNSFGRSPSSDSLAFVGGIPIFNRFFLGGEDTLRGYNIRSISPIAELIPRITTREVRAQDFLTGRKLPVIRGKQRFRGVRQSVLDQFTYTDKITNTSGRPIYTPIGADTQLLYNIEYRIPLAGPFSIAAFADAGTAFNLASMKDEILLSPTLDEIINPQIVLNPRGYIAKQKEIDKARTPETPPGALPKGFRYATIAGKVTRSTLVRLSDDLGGIARNFRTSVGLELRLLMPVVGVPFRLIFAYNPNAKTNLDDPTQIFLEQKRTIRLTVGRTF